MSNNPYSIADTRPARVYQIRIEGHLSPQWIEWFEGLTLTQEEGGETLLTGPVIDQAALFGILKKVRDLGISLVSVNRVESRHAEAREIPQTDQKRSKGDSDEHR